MIEDKLLEMARRFEREARERYSEDLAEKRDLMDKAVDVLAELRTERDEARKQIADLLSEAPCPYCGAGVTSKCYGCQVKALEVKLAEARDDLSRLRAAISDWLKQECAPDCAACCVLDAALVVPEAWAEDK